MLLKRIAASSRMGRQLDLIRSVESWAADELASRTDSSRAKTRELNADLRTRFSRVSVAMDGRYVDIVAHRRASNTGRNDERRIDARFDRREAQRYLPLARRSKLLHRMWDDAEIIASLQDWAAANGRSPKCTDWARASWDRPSAIYGQAPLRWLEESAEARGSETGWSRVWPCGAEVLQAVEHLGRRTRPARRHARSGSAAKKHRVVPCRSRSPVLDHRPRALRQLDGCA